MVLSATAQLAQMGIKLDQMVAEAPSENFERFQAVPRGPELLRVMALPRRPIPSQESGEAIELARFLTERLSKVESPYPGALRPIQALALAEAWQQRGLFAPIRVGGGKSLLSFLLPVVLGSVRPLYICPASMIPDISAEFVKYTTDWQSVNFPIISYEKIASPNSAEDLDADGNVLKRSLLERLAPTLIVLDESHRCAAAGATTTKRIKAYKLANPDTIIVAMSGSAFKTSIKDASHVMYWCLGDGSPLPHDFVERESWASYLDAKAGMGPRAEVGALLEFLTAEEKREYLAAGYPDDERTVVRRAIARRLLETPGIIGTQDPPLETGLTIEATYPLHEDPAVEEAFEAIRRTWALPDGTALPDGLEMNRHCDTLGLGFWNRWEPSPPEDWKDARNTWSKWCRKAIKSNRRGIDSEARMKDAVRKGLYDDEGALKRWEAARDTERERTGALEPPVVAVWVSDETVEAARAWISEHGGLIWTKSIALGERLAKDLSIPYYGAKGLDAGGRHIKKHPGGPAVASIAANGTGRNLQKFWSANLWLAIPNEQNLGRTHRAGQTAAVVSNFIYLGCGEHLKSFYAASTHKSKFAEELQSSPQKLRYAATEMPTTEEVEERGGTRWAVKAPK